MLRGLDLGVNDYLARPIDRNELLARVRTQLRHKRYADSLRNKVQQSIELALVDPLTGLNNRRFLENHLATMLDQAQRRRAPLSLMIFDIDHFKSVNDTYGHDCGDEVLKGFADRLRRVIRGGDLLCRLRRRGIRHRHAQCRIEVAAKDRRAHAHGDPGRGLSSSTRRGRTHPDHGFRRRRRAGARTATPIRSTGAPIARSIVRSRRGATA